MSTDLPAVAPGTDPPSPGVHVRGAATAFSDYVSVLGARFSSVVLSLVTITMSSRILGPSGFAIVAYVALISGLISAVTSSWTANAFSRYGREELETGGSVVAVTWARFVLGAPLLVACAAVLAVLEVVGALPRQLTWLYLALAVGCGVFTVTAEQSIYAVEVYGRMKLSALWIVLGQLLVAAGLAVVIVSGRGRSPLTVVALVAGAQLAITVALVSRSWTAMWPPTFDRRILRRVLRFSAPMIAFTFSQYVISAADIVVIHAYRPAADVGIYAVAYRGYSVLQSLALASGPVLTPLFVSLRVANQDLSVRRFVDRTVAQMSVFVSVLTGVVAAAVPAAVVAVAGHAFHGAAAPLTILLLANVAFFMASLLVPVLALYERTRAVGVINLAAAGINVLGDIVLIGVFGVGIVGGAIATACAVAFVWAGYLWVARESVGLTSRINPLVFAPAVIGVVAPLAHAGLALDLLGALGAVVAGAAIVRLGGLLAAQDQAFISKLDIPPRLKRVIQSFVSAVSPDES
jgi:O-antigen/teichoic acid export membrane protein